MKHTIHMTESKHEVTNRDVVFSNSKGHKKIGEMRVSKGNLVWITGNGRVSNYITWEDFNLIMTKGGTVE